MFPAPRPELVALLARACDCFLNRRAWRGIRLDPPPDRPDRPGSCPHTRALAMLQQGTIDKAEFGNDLPRNTSGNLRIRFTTCLATRSSERRDSSAMHVILPQPAESEPHHAVAGMFAWNWLSNCPRSFCRQRSRTVWLPLMPRSDHFTAKSPGSSLRLKMPTALEPSDISLAQTSNSPSCTTRPACLRARPG